MNLGTLTTAVTATLILSGICAAATYKVPEQHKTITEALAARTPDPAGDLIEVSAGTYTDNPLIMAGNLTIVGKGEVVIDRSGQSGLGVYADNVRFENLRFTNVAGCIEVVGYQFSVVKCTFKNVTYGIAIAGDHLSVEKYTFKNMTVGVYIDEGNHCSVVKSKFQDGLDGVWIAEGVGHLVEGNTFTNLGHYGIRAYCSRTLVDDNDISGCGLGGMVAAGPMISITGNAFTDNTSAGILVGGTPGQDSVSIHGNVIADTAGTGIYLDDNTHRCSVMKNTIKGSSTTAIVTEQFTSECFFSQNVIKHNTKDPAMYIWGSGHTVSGNKITRGATGIVLDAPESRVVDNVISRSVVCGIAVGLVNAVVSGNVIRKAGFAAIEMSAAGGRVLNNKVIGGKDGITLSVVSSDVLVGGNVVTKTSGTAYLVDGQDHTICANTAKKCKGKNIEEAGTGGGSIYLSNNF